jgi:hypothetical protein
MRSAYNIMAKNVEEEILGDQEIDENINTGLQGMEYQDM